MTASRESLAGRIDQQELAVGRRIQSFSQLAGPLTPPPTDGPYRVAFKGLDLVRGKGRALRTLAVAVFALAFETAVVVWVLQPTHMAPAGTGFARVANVIVIASIVVMEALRLANVVFIALCSIVARDPVPVTPVPERRVAFLTTIVPSKEPIDVVRHTLQAALRIRYEGVLDVWILDEGDDPAVKAMCRQLGVNHFTRRGEEKYNRVRGAFKARTKHGNYNAWVAEHGDRYEVFLSVDPDHVPLPNYAERILGYFRDPDVAFVSAPQCYANDESFVTRAAEAQQFLFHSLIQRAANRFHAAMLVGTNNAVRISALRRVGGLSDSVTEDLATGLKVHSMRNPASGKRWKSVYTPDVLAVGEGPSSWGDFFTQQLRWSRGTFEVLLADYWRRLPRLRPGAALHYILLSAFYPSMAIGWIFGAVNACLFLAVGVQGIVVPVQLWFALYVDAAAIQLWLYLRNRRYNVSPYEPEGSSGVKGMLMSTVAAPVYVSSMIAALLRLPARFVVTPKGVSTSVDGWSTFRRHLQWGLLVAAAVIIAIVLGHAKPAVLLWPAVMLLACAVPLVAWILERVLGRQPAMESEGPRSSDGKGVTTESLQRAALDQMVRSGSVAPVRSPLTVAAPARSATTAAMAAAPPAGPAPAGHDRPGLVPAGRPGAPMAPAAVPVGSGRAGRSGPGGAPGPVGPGGAPPPRENGRPMVGDLPPGWRRSAPRPGGEAERHAPTGERPDGADAATGRLQRSALAPPPGGNGTGGPVRPDARGAHSAPPDAAGPARAGTSDASHGTPGPSVDRRRPSPAGQAPSGRGAARGPATHAAYEEPMAKAGRHGRPADVVGPLGPRFPGRPGKRARTEADESQTDTLARIADAGPRPVELPGGAGTNSDDAAVDGDESSVHASTAAVRVVALAAVARPAEEMSPVPAGEQTGAS